MHILATAGHVDHGKSTLVKRLTGTDPDRFAEEKARGLTIDLGFAALETPGGRRASIIDVPGHVRFLKNMLAGVGAIDACLFVVAGTEGWKPQSEEHLRILELLGVRHGLVVMTKVGIADDDLRELARLDIEEHVAGTFLDGAPIVEVDAIDGTGVGDLLGSIDDLLTETPTALDSKRPRLWIDRAFSAKGSGTVVTGTLLGGRVRVEDELILQPAGKAVRVRALQSHSAERTKIGPGNRVAVNLGGISHDEVQRGDVLVAAGQWHLADRFDAALQVLDSVDHAISRRGAHVVYLGSGEHAVKVRILGPSAIEPGQRGSIRVYLPRALPLLPGDRFVLRESGRSETIGGGEILDIDPVKSAATARPDRSLQRVVAERGWVDVDQLERLTGERVDPTIGHWVVDPPQLETLLSDLRTRVDDAAGLGLDVASLDERERAALELLDGILVEAGHVRPVGASDPVADHPFVAALAASPFSPPNPDGVDRAELRELVRRGQVIEEDGVFFAAGAIDEAARLAARLLAEEPAGFTVSEFRDAAGNTRKHALPLLARLDGIGVTRRRDDVRIAGPRLPSI